MRRLALRLAVAIAVVALVWAGGRLYMRQAIYPAPLVAVGAPPAGYEDVTFRTRGGELIHGFHGGTASPERPLVIFFHGNGENLETLKYAGIFDRWRELDVGALAIDYPGYGRSGGRPRERGVVAAGTAALDWARAHHPDRPLVVAGWSLGAAVAIQVAAARPDDVGGVVLMSAWTTIADVARAHFPGFLVRLILRERYDSLAVAPAVVCPTLVIHGRRDRIIPAEQGERLARALGPETRWLPVDGAGHNDLLGHEIVWHALGSFLSSLAR